MCQGSTTIDNQRHIPKVPCLTCPCIHDYRGAAPEYPGPTVLHCSAPGLCSHPPASENILESVLPQNTIGELYQE